MGDVFFSVGTYRRDNGHLPELRVVNMLSEAAKTTKRQVALLSRPAVVEFASWGTGPVRGILQQDGLFHGDKFAVIGSTLYREGVALGQIAGSGAVSFANSRVELVVTAGSYAYSYLEVSGVGNFAKIALPDDFEALAVTFLATLFIFVRKDLVNGDASHRWYWSASNNARRVDDLDFASAESSPDPLLDIAVMGDNIALLGTNTIEFWMIGGSVSLPFTRITQRMFRRGVRQTGAATEHDNTLWFVGDDHTLYRISDVPTRMSDHGIEERISASATCTTFAFNWQGHQFLAIRLDAGTWLFDSATGEFCEFATLKRNNWRARCAAMVKGQPVFGDDAEGKLLHFSGFVEDAADLERLFTVAVPLDGTTPLDVMEVECDTGWTGLLAGEGREPIIEARMSRDKGATWTPWKAASMGKIGEHRKRARWRRWGYGDAPGVLWEVRMSDPASLRVSNAKVNEAGGGRGR